MAQSSAPGASACAERTGELIPDSQASPAGRLRGALTRLAPLLDQLVPTRLVPAMIAVTIASAAGVAMYNANEEKRRIVREAIAEIELVSALAARQFDDVAKNTDKSAATREAAAALLASAAPASALKRGRSVFVADAQGRILASAGAATAGASLVEVLGHTQPLTTFLDAAGAMRIADAKGRDVIAAARALAPPYGQIAVAQTVEGALAGWSSSTTRAAMLLGALALALAGVGWVYVNQARRTRAADLSCAQTNSKIDAALNLGRCGLWDWDIGRGRIYWSESMYDILGLTRGGDFLSFREIEAMTHPDDGALTRVIDELAQRRAGTIDHIFRMRNARGEWTWLKARAALSIDAASGEAHIVGVAVDVTDETLRAQQSATADMRLRDGIETISEAFVLWDADNRLVVCNSKFQRLHGLAAQAAQPGVAYGDLIAGSSPITVEARVNMRECPRGDSRSYEAQLEDGRWLQINERRTKDGGYVSVGTDITALKRHEEQLLDSERKLMATVADLRRSRQTLETQTQQLAELAELYLEQKAEAESANLAKANFLANMSHELRTPLNAIIGFAEMMEMETFGELNRKYLDYACHIRQSGGNLLKVVSDVLDMSRLESGRVTIRPESIDLGETVNGCLERFADYAKSRSLTIDVDSSLQTLCHADAGALEKALGVLLHNALKFSRDGGLVSLRARVAAGQIDVIVEDNGRGIPAAAMERLGRPFEQFDDSLEDGMKGSGLGLAIARSLIELHGGRLTLRSQPDAGTIARITLPQPQARAQTRDERTQRLRVGAG